MFDLMADTGRRCSTDRRRCPTPIISRFTFRGGKRRHIRRGDEKRKHLFVDLYSKRLLIAVVAVLLLSCIDAYLTLTLIERGVVIEANPFMAYLMNYGVMPFTITKFIVTASALIILCLFKNVRITRIGLPIAINIYVLVVIYECYIYLA